jgi:superfamily II DNA/RNA helicase
LFPGDRRTSEETSSDDGLFPSDRSDRCHHAGRAGRSGTAISIVAPIDQKSVTAIEKLIGQTIPRLEGFTAELSQPERAEAHPTEARRHPRRVRPGKPDMRHGKAGHKGKPQRKSEGKPQEHGRDAAHSKPVKPPSIGRLPPRPVDPPGGSPELADQSHLPAFLLRPTRARA